MGPINCAPNPSATLPSRELKQHDECETSMCCMKLTYLLFHLPSGNMKSVLIFYNSFVLF